MRVKLPSTRNVPVTDPEVALQRLGGDKTLYAALVSYFLQDAPELMQRLREAHRAGALQAVVETAHGLKGLAATFEALPFVQVASDFESVARSGNREGLDGLLPQLESEFARLFGELEIESAALPPVAL